ncbi:MAG: histidine phosphatase family protein [Anaerolineales bacterium]|nr:histidine phosphatase family protein [Anaerolineales bacterium]
MPIILLIRHGENDYVKKGRLAGRQPGIHLNDTGRKQAQALADDLTQKFDMAAFKAIYSSPLERTMETAKPIAESLELEVIPRPGLLETDYGEWQDKKLKGLSRLKIWRVVQFSPSRMRFPGGETFAETQFRICQEIESLCEMHEPKDMILCVTHADPIKLAVAHYLGMHLDMFQRLIVSPGSITTLQIRDASARLFTLNFIPSLNTPEH